MSSGTLHASIFPLYEGFVCLSEYSLRSKVIEKHSVRTETAFSSAQRGFTAKNSRTLYNIKCVLPRNTNKETHTHLPVENDAPDEPENQFVIPINDVCRSDIHQFNLEEETTDRHILIMVHFTIYKPVPLFEMKQCLVTCFTGFTLHVDISNR